MKHALALSLLLAAAPLAAQEVAPEMEDDRSTGSTLIEEGARLFLRGLIEEMEPGLDELARGFDEIAPILGTFLYEMGPALTEILESVDSLANYGPPELLPNGDILIQRRPDAPPWEPPSEEVGEGGEVDL